MSRRSVVWLLTLPLAVVGSQVAHALTYRLVTQTDSERAHELAASGHGYLAYAPVALAICAVLVVLTLAHELMSTVAHREHRPSRPSALSFAVLAPAIFVGQELFERLLHDGALPFTLVYEKTFALGLVLQLPFALLAYVLARLLLGATRAVARLLAAPRAVVLRSRSRWHRAEARLPRSRPAGLALGPRGPPAILAS